MSVHCAHCGEELMGAVNRCWKCGRTMESHAGPADVPPIRRSPVVLTASAALEATLLDEPQADGKVTQGVRVGSPFQSGAIATQLVKRKGTKSPASHWDGPQKPPLQIKPSNWAGRQLSAIVSLILAIGAVGLSFSVPIASFVLSLAVLPLGIWGLFGAHRKIAAVALAIGCIGIAWGAFHSLVQVYQMMYGVHPFA